MRKHFTEMAQIHVKVEVSEKEIISRAADRLGLTLTDFVRQMVLMAAKEIDSGNIDDLPYLLNSTGVMLKSLYKG